MGTRARRFICAMSIRTFSRKWAPWLLCLQACLAGCQDADTREDQVPLDTLHQAAIEDPGRWPEDRQRDAASRPADVLAFMALAPGMRVLDFQAGNGYFSELFSRVVGPAGRVYAHNHASDGFIGDAVFERRYGGERLANVEKLFARHNDLDLPE